MKLYRNCLALCLLCLCGCAWGIRTVEVVQTVPVETGLSVPGVRDSLAVWLEMIQSAKSTLDIEQFYISDQAGEPLADVLSAISDAGRRGVKVRLLVDKVFYKTYPESVNQLGEGANSEARIIDFSKYGGVQHAKFFIVDNKDCFSGSQNFDWRALKHIHEVGLRVIDESIAKDLEAIFNKDWAEGVSSRPVSKWEEPSSISVAVPKDTLQVVASPPAANPEKIQATSDAIIKLMNSAKRTLKIQVMEYSTKPTSNRKEEAWRLLDSAIRAAAGRGVQVQLMVDVSDVKKAKNDLLSLNKVANAQVRVVTIPEWSGGHIDYARLIHSKYLIIDGSASWVGSENWSQGYFLDTRNVGFVTNISDVNDKLTRIFDQLWGSAYAKVIE